MGVRRVHPVGTREVKLKHAAAGAGLSVVNLGAAVGGNRRVSRCRPSCPSSSATTREGWSASRHFAQVFSKITRDHSALRALTPRFQYVVDDLSHLSDTELKRALPGYFPTLASWGLA
jgi:hypothetical protein